MKQDKFLSGIIIGIGALILLALALFFTRQDRRAYVADTTPDGVVHNYVLAVLNKDYQKAYSYLADLENKPTYEEFRRSFFDGTVNPSSVGVEIGAVETHENEVIVSLTLYYSNTDPFSTRYGSPDRALLVKQNGAWKLNSMPYNFWDYRWYQEPYKP